MQTDDFKIRLIVHQSQAGCVIGKAGFKVKELREVGPSVIIWHLAIVYFFPATIVTLYCSLSLVD